MPPLRRAVCAFLLGWAASVLGAAPERVELPALDGRISGQLASSKLVGGAPVAWVLELHTPGPGKRGARLALESPGMRLRLRAQMNASGGGGEWAIEEGNVEPAQWWTAVRTFAGEAFAESEASGYIEISGAGEFRDGVPVGVLGVRWRDGSLRHRAAGWSVEGIGFSGKFAVEGQELAIRSQDPFELRVGTITTGRFGARNLLVRAVLEHVSSLAVREARIEIAGGDVTLDPCTIPLSPVSLDLKLRLVRVGLQDVAALVPEALAEARGRVDGSVGLRWSEQAGLQLGAGHFAVRKDEPAEVRLRPTPGLISASLPAMALQYYPGLAQIETGEVPLRAELLEVVFTPEGDAEGRTARVRMAGGPVDPRLRAPIDLTVNIRGPLETLIRLGTDSRLRFGGR